MSDIARMADEAQGNAELAATALDMLTQLVVNKDLGIDGAGYLDVDAYSVFAEGIMAYIRRTAEQAGEIHRLARESM